MLNRGLLGHDPALGRRPRDHDQRDDADRTAAPATRSACRPGSTSSPPAIVGLATSVAFVYITQYYTAGSFRPVREIAEASKTGPATNIIARHRRRLRDDRRHRDHDRHRAVRQPLARRPRPASSSATGVNVGGIFGTAVATMGMLMTTAYILAMDTFGPITDNAGGIAEFSRAEAGAREITDRLDAVGNTTKALTKGYAIASASLAAFLLFSAYIDKINLIQGRRLEAGVPGASSSNVGQPGERQRLHRGVPRGDARLLLQLARDPRGRQDGPVDHRRGPPPVPRDARDHGLQPATGLRPRRRHHDQGRPPRDGPPGPRRGRSRRSSSACSSAPRPSPAC